VVPWLNNIKGRNKIKDTQITKQRTKEIIKERR
jgi:hypothetical protein